MQEPPAPTPRSLNGLGLIAYILFLAAGLALGVWLRDHGTIQENGRVGVRGAAEKPNIVVVMTDDQTLEQMRAMPRTRRLIGGEGIEFERFFVTDPLCCPSRATLLTGQYAHNHGVVANVGQRALPALDEERTLATWLEDAGYRTTLVGKYMNEYGLGDAETVPPGWSEWHALVEPTTQNYYGYTLNQNGSLRRYGDEPEDYKTRVLGHLATAAVRNADHAGRPLFLFLGFNAPHAPSTPAPRDAGTFADAPPHMTPAFDEDDMSDKPSFLRHRPPLDDHALARIADRRQRGLESLVEVDRQIERLVETLERHDELDDTYIFFTSDNGYLDGEHRVEFGKLLPYDGSSHVPLLVRGPRIPAGTTTDALAGNVDLAATIVGLAEADATAKLDGRSLMPLASDPSRPSPGPLLVESLVRDRSTYYGYPYTGIRTDRYLYVRYDTGDEELYDLATDPFELESVADAPQYGPTARKLRSILRELADCAGEECIAQITPPPPPASAATAD